MIRVWVDNESIGHLDRFRERGSAFVYDPQALDENAVSLTMPVRTASWNADYGLAPIFEMNLPEGALRELLMRRFAKAVGRFDDFDLLGIVGRAQIGRVRYSASDEDLSVEVPFQSLDEILKAKRGGDFFDYLLETFAIHSGLSGVQPKVMVRGHEDIENNDDGRIAQGFRSATHIVKFWEEDEYPDLAANEFFCLEAAKSIGLEVPKFQLSEDGGILIVERFDFLNGKYLGFEDFCVLNGFRTSDKYSGGYESKLFSRMQDYVDKKNIRRASQDLFKLFVLNCAIRNGDAHLKNFGVIYKTADSAADLAPVYDLVTTTAYIPNDPMALTLGGSTKWPDRQRLLDLGQTRADLSQNAVEQIFELVADTLTSILPKLRRYFKDSQFEVGKRMAESWETGIQESIGSAKNSTLITKNEKQKPEARRKKIANSDSRILEHIREKGGEIKSTLKALAGELKMPYSTLTAAIKRLSERQLIERDGRDLKLLDREV